jgi:hypothetical protein
MKYLLLNRSHAIYGALLTAFQSGVKFTILMEIEANKIEFVQGFIWYKNMRHTAIEMLRSKD